MKRRFLVLLIAALAFVPTAWAQIPASDDAFTASGVPNVNYGTTVGLVVQSPAAPGTITNPPEPTGYTANAFVKFPMSALPPNLNAANFSKATLRLYVDYVASTGSFDVSLASGAWAENTLTASNAPPPAQLVAGAIAVTKALKYVDVDVSPAVAAWLNGAPNYGLVLTPSAGSKIFVSFDSKENALTSHDPQLLVFMNVPGSIDLTNEVQRATQAENNIATNLAAEAVRARSAEDSESKARSVNDTLLQNNIGAVQSSLSGYAQVAKQNTFIANQTFQGDLGVAAGGVADANSGFASHAVDLTASVFDGALAQNETFRWQSAPVNNNTPDFGAQLNLLYGVGTTPVPTGFSFNKDGTVNFAGNQRFSGDGSGLLNVKAKIAESANTAAVAVSAETANTANNATNAQQLGGLSSSAFAKVASSNNFIGDQTVNGNVKLASASNGIVFGDGTVQTTAATASGTGTRAGFSGMQEFTASGTWIPPNGVTHVLVEMWGGGGGGTYGGGGGGGGAYTRGVVAVNPAETYLVIVGRGGQGGDTTTGTAASDGTDSTLKSTESIAVILAGGGKAGISVTDGGMGGEGGTPDRSAALSRAGFPGTTFINGSGGDAGRAYGGTLCPNGDTTGDGGKGGFTYAASLKAGKDGYVLLTW